MIINTVANSDREKYDPKNKKEQPIKIKAIGSLKKPQDYLQKFPKALEDAQRNRVSPKIVQFYLI